MSIMTSGAGICPGDGEYLGKYVRGCFRADTDMEIIAEYLGGLAVVEEAVDDYLHTPEVDTLHDVFGLKWRSFVKNLGADFMVKVAGDLYNFESGRSYCVPRQTIALILQKGIEGGGSLVECNGAEFAVSGENGFLLV